MRVDRNALRCRTVVTPAKASVRRRRPARCLPHLLAAAIACALAGCGPSPTPSAASGGSAPLAFQQAVTPGASQIEQAFASHAEDLRVEGGGRVVKVLRDDDEGSRHQKFLVEVGSVTILVAHNIDLAPRVEPLAEGDTIAFAGEYVWNPKGGVVHWTHHDPSGRHPAGWLRHDGQTFQ